MSTGMAVAVIALGVVVLLFGRRMALLGAGAGALLGLGLLQFLPGTQDGVVGLLVVFGLAIAVGIFAVVAKGVTNLVIMGIGFIAGGALVFAGLDALGLDLGVWGFIIALVGGLIAAVLANRFFDWAVIVLAGLVGAALVMRGLQILVPDLVGLLGPIIGLVLAVLGIIYQARKK